MKSLLLTAGALLLLLFGTSVLVSCQPSTTMVEEPTPGILGGHPVALSAASFEDQTRSGVVLVDFWAAWCGPCREIAPVLDSVAADYAGRAIIAKVDIDAEPGLADRFGIESIPNLKIFKNGKVVDEIVGLVPRSEIERRLNAQL